jgi:uncharacterized protein (DUF1499 family)
VNSIIIKTLIGTVSFFTLLLLLGLLSLKSQAKVPTLGVDKNGKLKPCPKSPNCVSSQTDQKDKYMPPIEVKSVPSKLFMKKIVEACEKVGSNVEWVKKEEYYLHAIFRSSIFKFPDDVEFFYDQKNNLIHFRSASRIGYSDLGVNRSRMSQIKEALD